MNGPGEAKEADIGIAGGIGEGLLIKKEDRSLKSRRRGTSRYIATGVVELEQVKSEKYFLMYFRR